MSAKEEETKPAELGASPQAKPTVDANDVAGRQTSEDKPVEAVEDVASTADDTSSHATDATSTMASERHITAQTSLEPAAKPQPPTECSSPGPRRPKPPTKGILKPPPPPAKPTLTNRLRDIVTVVGGGAKSLFDPLEHENAAAGPSTPQPPSVGGTLNAIGGRLSMGFSRFVSPPNPSPSAPPPSVLGTASPAGSPLPKSMSLPETGGDRAKPKQPLKRATFLLPSMSITYPISSSGEPWSQKVLEDRQRIESTHRNLLTTTTGAEYWTSQRLVTLYENACKAREERARVGIVRALEVLPKHPRPRQIHIILRSADSTAPSTISSPHTIDVPLNRHAAEALADVLTAECGLLDLKLESGVIDGDDVLKPILHALLVSGTLPTLSLAGNKKIKSGGWRLLAVFMKRAKSLRFVDLSDTIWDKKSIDYLVQALNGTRIRPPPVPEKDGLPDTHDRDQETAAAHAKEIQESKPQEQPKEEADGGKSEHSAYGSFVPPAPLLRELDDDTQHASVQSLRMDGCGLKANVLESLAQGVRSSDLKNISLRRNRIGPLGAVALAIMIRDYPDGAMLTSLSPQLNALPSLHYSTQSTLDRSPTPLPYAARRRPTPKGDDDAPLPPIPLVVSSAAGGVTSRTLPEGYKPPALPKHPLVMPSGGNSAMQEVPSASFAVNAAPVEGRLSHAETGGASMALQRSVRALDGVERIGRLLTLDLKSNEIRHGVGYIAQVLKRNRTLKVLNLSDNRIDGAGLALLAEALKYNSTLETLDLSNNPCCGAQSEGIAALRTAFTVNTSLKRLFLSDTNLTTEGAISLAEFLPESKSLLHLDLTNNPAVDTAGILAISVGLRSNHLIRCLDISIPPNNPELADISQNILQACIRNTESAAGSLNEGKAESIWVPIKKSVLVRQVKQAEEARAEQERVDLATSPEGQAREFVYTLKPEQVEGAADKTVKDCERWYEAGKLFSKSRGTHVWEPGQLPKKDFAPLLQRARVLRERLAEILGEMTDADKLVRLLELNDGLTNVIDRSKGFTPPPRLLLPSQIVPTTPTPPVNGNSNGNAATARFLSRRHMRGHSLEISSPNFSIGDSDADSDAEELDVEVLPTGNGRRTSSTEQLAGLGLGADIDEAREQGNETIELPEDGPVEKASKAWVEEEGEIFRKGTMLGVADSDEEDEDRSGEQLKQEILDTPVARSNARRRMSVEDADRMVDVEGDDPRGVKEESPTE